jgi:5-methyltetrahydrofolate--homocysteine methyltransferase
MSRFLDALRSGLVLLMDGAMGTELQRAGLQPGECGELWNLTHPERVRAVHQAYVDAGAEVLLTNTFLADPVSLARYDAAGRWEVICRAGVELARAVAGPGRWVLASVGPSEFLGEWQALPRYLSALSSADGVLVETCSSLAPFVNALQAMGRLNPAGRVPVLASLTYLRSRDGTVETHFKQTPGEVAREAERHAPRAALGANCGREIAMRHVLDVIHAYRDNSSLPRFARPNAGTPREADGRWVYPHTPEAMASWLPPLLAAGVSMVGGCCGTTPAHIAAFRPLVDAWNARQGFNR